MIENKEVRLFSLSCIGVNFLIECGFPFLWEALVLKILSGRRYFHDHFSLVW